MTRSAARSGEALGRLVDLACEGPAWPWLALGLALRVGFAGALGERFHQIDEVGFDGAARQFAVSGFSELNLSAVVPAAFFGVCYKIFGAPMAGARLAQAAASAALPWLVGKLAATAVSPKAGRLALIVAAVYPFFIYYSGLLMSEALYLLFATAGLWLLVERRPAAGLLMGLAALCRIEGMFVMLSIWALLILLRRWRPRALAAALLLWALPLGGWALRNKLAGGVWTLDTHGGMTLMHGVLYFDENERDTSEAQAAFERSELHRRVLKLSDHERDRILKAAALRAMVENPGRTLRQWGRKFVNFWRFYPRADKVYHETQHSDPTAGVDRRLLTFVSLIFEPALIFGGLAGLFSLRSRWRDLAPLWLWLLGTMALHVVSVSQMRYRLPVMPVLIAGACALAQRQSRQR